MLKTTDIIDKILNNPKYIISDNQFEILLRYLEVSSHFNFKGSKKFYKEDFNKSFRVLLLYLNDKISDLRLLNFFLKNRSLLQSLGLNNILSNVDSKI